MKPNELRDMSVEDLQTRLGELTEERFRLRFRSATESIENPMRFRTLRRDIAILWKTVAGIFAGTERRSNRPRRRYTLGERLRSARAHGLVFPLVTAATGVKFGKTEAGAVWLDAKLTSPYRFYQFWLNTDDRDAARYLRLYTLMSRTEIG